MSRDTRSRRARSLGKATSTPPNNQNQQGKTACNKYHEYRPTPQKGKIISPTRISLSPAPPEQGAAQARQSAARTLLADRHKKPTTSLLYRPPLLRKRIRKSGKYNRYLRGPAFQQFHSPRPTPPRDNTKRNCREWRPPLAEKTGQDCN